MIPQTRGFEASLVGDFVLRERQHMATTTNDNTGNVDVSSRDLLAVSDIDAIFRPTSVAVIGASRQKHSIGWEILHNMLSCEFQGEVAAVNPSGRVVHSLHCYPSVEDVPGPVDLGILVVPSRYAVEAAESCGRKGVRGLVVITAGFKEVGEAGASLEQELLAVARKYHMRMVGPNCMGVINTDPAVSLQATFSSTQPLPGNIAFSSQSGALGEAVLASMRELGLGLSMFVSLGNKADVSGNDVLEYWEHDPRTKVILMYLESFGNPKRFVQIARRVTARKPILAVKSGRTAAGARAAVSHTGSLAGADIAVESLLAQCGVIRAASIKELFVYASVFASQPVPRGDRVAILTNSGGPGILATDACVQLGLTLTALEPDTQDAMRAVLAPEASVTNPVDMIASATGQSYEHCLRALAADANVDALITIFTSLEMFDNVGVARSIVRGLEGCTKPVLVCFMGKAGAQEAIELLKGAGLPVFTFPEDASHALAALVRYRRWLERPAGQTPHFADFDRAAISAIFGTARAERRHQLTLAEAQRVIEGAGIRMAPWMEAATREQAVKAADQLGYPVALKVSSSAIVHKSDVSGVRLDLEAPRDVSEAADELLAAARGVDPKASLVVQRMVDGTEVIFGASLDPKFGPLMMFGLGGIFVEVLKDVAFRVHPISDVDAAEMIHEVKAFPILSGARGGKPVAIGVLEDTLLRLNQLLSEFPEIREFDVNPFFAAPTPEGCMAADARIVIGD
jgi:acetyl coenzyme A synthetase (ADP forming)-like protein